MYWFFICVYYEDIDLVGIVYYVNYLKFIECVCSEWLCDLGVDQLVMKCDVGVVFVVCWIEVDYLVLVQFDDFLQIELCLYEIGQVCIIMCQKVLCEGWVLFFLVVMLVCMLVCGWFVCLFVELIQCMVLVLSGCI